MPSKLVSSIETTTPIKRLLPWVVINRHGRQSVESQFFALLGYSENDLLKLTPSEIEESRDALEFALRLTTSFEYIPKDESELDDFFEKKLVQFETRLQERLPQTPTLHAAIGVLQGTRVLFAISGDILALQVTSTSINSLGEAAVPGQFHFETFRAGILSQRSYLLFTPKQMGTLLKSEELKTMAGAVSSERKLNFLTDLWEKRTALPNNFRAILLEAKPRVYKTAETTAISIAHLLNTEAKTEELLSPPLLRPMWERIYAQGGKLREQLSAFLQTYTVKGKPERTTRPTVVQTTRGASASADYRSLTSYLLQFRSWVKAKFKFRLPKLNTAALLKPQLPSGAPLERFNALPLKSKILFILVTTLLFVFIESVFLTMRRSQIRGAEAALAGEISAINTLIETANASLIYNDEVKATTEIEEARSRIANLPEFQKQIAKQYRISSFRPVQSRITNSKIDELNGALIPIQDKLAHIVTIENPSVVDESVRNSLKLGSETPAPLIYNRRLYTLEKEKNQIYRHEPVTGGFAEGKPWIQDGTSVQNFTTLAIDGSIYASDGSGNVIQLLRGKKTDFSLKPTSPPLTTIKKLWTNEKSDYLYVLDPQEKRLAVFAKKDGLLKAQYKSPKFTDLKDFSVDESKKTAYLLDGTAVLAIPLSHF